MGNVADAGAHAGLLITGPTGLSGVDLNRLTTLVEAFDQGLISPVEVAGSSIGETMDLIASRRAA